MEKSDSNYKQHTGKQGEELASRFLQDKGYIILHQNWRYSKCEVDLIASRDNILYFVEVKTRTDKSYGPPEQKVGKAKLKQLKIAAEAYLHQNPQWINIQFDLIAITMLPAEKPELFFIEDIF